MLNTLARKDKKETEVKGMKKRITENDVLRSLAKKEYERLNKQYKEWCVEVGVEAEDL